MTPSEPSVDADAASRSPLPLPTGPLVGFGLAIAAVIVMVLMSLRTHDESSRTVERVLHTSEVVRAGQALLSAIKDAETGQRGYLLTGDASYLDPFRDGSSQLSPALRRARELVSDNPEQLRRLAQVDEVLREKLAELNSTVELRRQGRAEEALAVVRTDVGKTRMDELRRLVSAYQDEERRLMDQRRADMARAQELSIAVTLAGSALLLVLIGGAGLMTSRDFRSRERETWVRQGLSDLATVLQASAQPSRIASAAVAMLARRCGAVVGAIYVTDPDSGELVLRGGYALPKDVPDHVPMGEGLVGQCASAGQLMTVEHVPAGHLQVASATGRSDSRTLVLCPATIDGQVEAVVELGFLARVRPEAQDLLGRAQHTLAMAIRNAKDRERTELLLAETQRQGEELQVQQEELRVSNEELETQSRALQQSQTELEAQQASLEQTNVQLEERTLDLERQKQALLGAQGHLEENARALETASRYKSEFLANMSHELRTPLNSSLILAKLLSENRDANLSPEQVKFARTIVSSNNDLLTLINDILDLSKVEAGHVDLAPEPLDVGHLVARLRDTFEPLTRQKGIAFETDLAPGAPTRLVADSQRLQQILKNLLSNAVKFTDTGSVRLLISAGAPGRIRFAVKDTGIGIAATQHEVIFEAFRQADGSTTRRYGGTGLGLSISRELAQRMGGGIEVESAPGMGSSFTLELPVDGPAAVHATPDAVPAPAAATPVPAPIAHLPEALPERQPERRFPGRLILAVEDDPAFGEALVAVANEMNFDCVVVGSAAAAIARARELAPSAILLDIGLPDVSGLTVLERLKRDPATRHIPVHMVSAMDRSQTALELGAVGYILKPASRESIAEALTQLEQRIQRTIRRLLVVEDDATLREQLKLLLASDGVDITGVGSVAEALRELSGSTFDCMVTDLALPDGSGYDLLERMASEDRVAFPPVIVYTGRTLTRDEEQRLRQYSKTIIVKGARSPERLLDEVTLFLHSVETSLPPEQKRILSQARRRDTILDGRVIVLAEDDVRNIFALSSVFEPLGARLQIARNGREAIERLEPGDVDLVLMDVMMPEMDGLEAMRRIRQDPRWTNLPIIALTAKAMANDREECLQAGASDYIAKPLDIDKLISLCRVWCPK